MSSPPCSSRLSGVGLVLSVPADLRSSIAIPLNSLYSDSFLPSRILSVGHLLNQNAVYALLLIENGFISIESSSSTFASLRLLTFSADSILLLARSSFFKSGQCCSPSTDVTRFFFAFSSTRLVSPLRLSIAVSQLPDRLSTLRPARCFTFSILDILFVCKSSTSSCLRASSPLILVIWFLLSISTLSEDTV